MDERNSGFGYKLKQARHKMGWTQTQLADEVGVDVRTVRRWENGESEPQGYARTRLKVVLGEALEELETPDGDNNELAVAEDSGNRSSEQETVNQSVSSAQPRLKPEVNVSSRLHKRNCFFVRVGIIISLLIFVGGGGVYALRLLTSKPSPTISFPEIFSQLKTRKPTFTDPLKQQSQKFHWVVFNDPKTSTGCEFRDGAYHALGKKRYPLPLCFAQKQLFTNFALQVDMTIIQGSGGGIAYRANPVVNSSNDQNNNATMYRLHISMDETYDFYVQDVTTVPKIQGNLGRCSNTSDPHATSQLYTGGPSSLSPLLKLGINQTNRIILIAREHNAAMYVDNQLVSTVCDPTSATGNIGFFAAPYDPDPSRESLTDVAYNNLSIWEL